MLENRKKQHKGRGLVRTDKGQAVSPHVITVANRVLLQLRPHLQQHRCGEAQGKECEGSRKGSEDKNTQHEDRSRGCTRANGPPHCSLGLGCGSRGPARSTPRMPSQAQPGSCSRQLSPRGDSSLQGSCSSGLVLTKLGPSLKSGAGNCGSQTHSGRQRPLRESPGRWLTGHRSDTGGKGHHSSVIKANGPEAAGPATQNPDARGSAGHRLGRQLHTPQAGRLSPGWSEHRTSGLLV